MAKGANSVWEIRPTAGSDTNGGAYNANISGAGTDYTQQNSAQLAITDAVTNNTTTVTSATGGFTSAMIGNALYLAGSGTTTDRYFITAVASTNSITVDRATGSTGGMGVTCNVGGALASLNEFVSARGGVAANLCWVKNTGTMTITSGINVNFGVTLPNLNPNCIVGYNVTRGDNPLGANRPTINTTSAIDMLTLSDANVLFANFNLTTSGATPATQAITGGATRGIYVYNVSASGNFATRAFNAFGTYIRVTGTGLGSGATSVFRMNANAFIYCAGFANACDVFSDEGQNTDGYTVLNCFAVNNTGTSIGFNINALGNYIISGCIAWNNGGDGLANIGTYKAFSVMNSIFLKNGGYGLNYGNNPLISHYPQVNYNAFGNNTAVNNVSGNRHNEVSGVNDVLLTADPFVSSGGSLSYLEDVLANFALNNTAGGGAVLRAAGYPAYLDIGPIQHQDSGGSNSTAIVRPAIVSGGLQIIE